MPKTVEELEAENKTLGADLADKDAQITTLKGKLDDVEDKNFKLREKRRELDDEVANLKTQIPQEGAHVLTNEQHAQWEAYQALGKPTEVKASLESGQAAVDKAKTYERAESIDKAAGTTYNTQALKGLLPSDAEIITKGEGESQTYLIKQGESETSLADWVSTKEADLGISLTVGDEPPSRPRVPTGAGRNPPVERKPDVQTVVKDKQTDRMYDQL